MRRRLLVLLLLLVAAPAASAHPVPKDNHDRTIIVHLTPDAVVVDYRLEVDEFRVSQDLNPDDVPAGATPQEFRRIFLNTFADILPNNLVARLDGRELEFTCVSRRQQLTDQVICDYRFRAPWKLEDGKSYRFTFRERNFHTDNFSVLNLMLDAGPQLTLRDLVAPSEELIARSPDKRKSEDDSRLRSLSATMVVTPSFAPGMARMGLPPDPEPGRDGASRRWRGIVGKSKPIPAFPVGSANPWPEEEAPTEHNELLRLLFDTKKGLAVLLLLAAGFGAAHALTPGHGKTLVAAYLVGQRGTVLHALGLGLVTTLTHTGGVILLAVVLAVGFRDMRPADVQTALALVGGLLIAGLGLWLFFQRLTGRADHFHLGGGHHHHHDAAGAPAASWWHILILGVQGGLIPCWDAILMLMLAISAQRLWLAVPLLLAFSAGLAAVLVGLGIAVVSAGHVARSTLGDDERLQKVARLLPIVSAAVITALGLFLTFAAVRTVS
jgi:nickel/cobalt exporter